MLPQDTALHTMWMMTHSVDSMTQPVGGDPPDQRKKTHSDKEPYKVRERWHLWQSSDLDRTEVYLSSPDFDEDPPVLRQWIDKKYGLI